MEVGEVKGTQATGLNPRCSRAPEAETGEEGPASWADGEAEHMDALESQAQEDAIAFVRVKCGSKFGVGEVYSPPRLVTEAVALGLRRIPAGPHSQVARRRCLGFLPGVLSTRGIGIDQRDTTSA